MNLVKILRVQWDRAAAILSLAVGVLALILGYIGVSSTAYTAEQIPYVLSGGIAGVFLLGVGATLYLSADIRDEWRKLDDVEEDLARVEAALAARPDIEQRLAAVERRLASAERPAPARRAAGSTRSPRSSERTTPKLTTRAGADNGA